MLKFMRRRWAVAAAVALVAVGATLLGSPSFATGTGVVSGTIFGDTDGDGIHDADEFGIGDVAVWVVADAGTNGQRPAARVRSAADGSWSVPTASLGSGPFGVALGDPIDAAGQPVAIESAASVTLPAGLNWTDRGPDHIGRWITGIEAGTTGIQFGVATCATQTQCVRPQIGGSVWFDADRDGSQGSSEPRIPGADVALLSGGEVLAALRTDADGRWVADEGTVAGGLSAVDQVVISVSDTAAVGVTGEPTQLLPTRTGVGSDAADSDGVVSADGSALLEITAGTSLSVVDVGFVVADAEAASSKSSIDPAAGGAGVVDDQSAPGLAEVSADAATVRSDDVAASQGGATLQRTTASGDEASADSPTTVAAGQLVAPDSTDRDGLGSPALAVLESNRTPVTAATTSASEESDATGQSTDPRSEPSVPSASASGRPVDFGEFEDELASGEAALGVGELPSLTDMPVVLPSADEEFSSTLPETGGNALRLLGAALMGVGMGGALVSFANSRRQGAR